MDLTGVHICVEVERFPEAMRFWKPLFECAGFVPLHSDGEHFAGYGNGTTAIWVGESNPRRVHREAPTGQEFVVMDHFGLHVTKREDVDAIDRVMRAAGFKPLFPAQEYSEFGPGFYAVTYCDPDHNVVEFAFRPQP